MGRSRQEWAGVVGVGRNGSSRQECRSGYGSARVGRSEQEWAGVSRSGQEWAGVGRSSRGGQEGGAK